MVGTFILVLVAIVISQAFGEKYNVHDSREIVIDEVVGYVVAMDLAAIDLAVFCLCFYHFPAT